jgi:hypothetical protein
MSKKEIALSDDLQEILRDIEAQQRVLKLQFQELQGIMEKAIARVLAREKLPPDSQVRIEGGKLVVEKDDA